MMFFGTCFKPLYSIYLPSDWKYAPPAIHQDTEGFLWSDYGANVFPRRGTSAFAAARKLAKLQKRLEVA